MIRTEFRRRVSRLVVLVLVTLMVAPFDEADDYAFLHTGPETAHAGLLLEKTNAPEAASDDGMDAHVCSCLVCLVALGESFAPLVPTPQPGEGINPVIAFLSYTPHLPRIYHPPIA